MPILASVIYIISTSEQALGIEETIAARLVRHLLLAGWGKWQQIRLVPLLELQIIKSGMAIVVKSLA